MPFISYGEGPGGSEGLQFYVNTEIGNLSAGSAAIAGTKDASFPGEYGQVGSYITGVKMVLPSGDLLEVTEDKNPELMQILRSSYGLLGIVYEVTYKIRPLTPMHVHHTTYSLQDFLSALPDSEGAGLLDDVLHLSRSWIRSRSNSANTIPARPASRTILHGRAAIETWGTVGPKLGYHTEESCSIPAVR